MLDILQVTRKLYPTDDSIAFERDEVWVSFGGEKPVHQRVNDQGVYEFSDFVDYETFLKEALRLHEAGELADWESFIETIPSNPLIVFIIQQKFVHSELSEPLNDLMLLIQFPSARSPQFIHTFWTRLLSAVKASGIEAPPEVIQEWNSTVETYGLPSWLKIG